MLVMRVEVEETQATRYSRATIRDILKGVYYQVALRWQSVYLPRHFKRGNQKRYRLRRRSRRYLKRKRAMATRGVVKKGGRVALVFRGIAERLFSSRHAIRAYPTRATIVMHGPRYVAMRPYKSQHHAIGLDITAMAGEEAESLDIYSQGVLERLLKRAPIRKRRRRRRRR